MVISAPVPADKPPPEQIEPPATPRGASTPRCSGGGLFVDMREPHAGCSRLPVRPGRAVRAFAAQPGRSLRAGGRRQRRAWRFASGVHGSGAWCYAADRRRGIQRDRRRRTGASASRRTKPVPIRVDARRRGRGARDRRSAARPSAADRDHRRRAQRTRAQCASTGESGARTTRVIDESCASFARHRAKAAGLPPSTLEQ